MVSRVGVRVRRLVSETHTARYEPHVLIDIEHGPNVSKRIKFQRDLLAN